MIKIYLGTEKRSLLVCMSVSDKTDINQLYLNKFWKKQYKKNNIWDWSDYVELNDVYQVMNKHGQKKLNPSGSGSENLIKSGSYVLILTIVLCCYIYFLA